MWLKDFTVNTRWRLALILLFQAILLGLLAKACTKPLEWIHTLPQVCFSIFKYPKLIPKHLQCQPIWGISTNALLLSESIKGNVLKVFISLSLHDFPVCIMLSQVTYCLRKELCCVCWGSFWNWCPSFVILLPTCWHWSWLLRPLDLAQRRKPRVP